MERKLRLFARRCEERKGLIDGKHSLHEHSIVRTRLKRAYTNRRTLAAAHPFALPWRFLATGKIGLSPKGWKRRQR